MNISNYGRVVGGYLALATALAGCVQGDNANPFERLKNCIVEGSSRIVTVKEPEGGIGSVVSRAADIAGVAQVDKNLGNIVRFTCDVKGRIDTIVFSYQGDQLNKGDRYDIVVRESPELGQNKSLVSAKQVASAQSTPVKK